MLLKDKVVIISGIGPGLGQELAYGAAREGAKIAIAARSTDLLNKLKDEIGKKSEVIAPKLITEPLNIGEREGIVTPSKKIVREPIGKGVVGLKEKEVIAPPANLTDRVPVGVDIFGRDKYGTLEKEGLEDIKRQKTPLSYDEFKQKVMSGEITRASKYSSPQALKIITQTLQNENADPNLKELQDRRLRTFYNYSQYKDPSKKTIISG